MLFKELVLRLGFVKEIISGKEELELTGATSDSRAVTPGMIFCAVKGACLDGHDYAADAVARGASCLLAEHRVQGVSSYVPQIIVSNGYQSLGEVAEIVAGSPAASFQTLTVTGTNGKTTSAYLLRDLLRVWGKCVGMVGTVEYDTGNGSPQLADRTTPTPFQLQELFFQMKANGVQYNVMEVSSHSLVQGRMGHLQAAGSIFTNLTQDHLDFHHTMEAYYEAKRLMFTKHLAQGAPAAINVDDPYGMRLAGELDSHPVFAMSMDGQGNTAITDMQLGSDGGRFSVCFPDGVVWRTLHTPLPGAYNVMNCAGVVCMAYALGIPEAVVRKTVEACHGAPGRMQPVTASDSPFAVYVDYAHTDDALKNVLVMLRQLKPTRLVVVFGCGGDRDRTKRPKMGRVAATYADMAYVTSDNPRTENPEEVIREILTGWAAETPYMICVDRREAIRQAIVHAEPGDIVLIAGKGHEDYQEISGVKHHFNDAEEALKVLQAR